MRIRTLPIAVPDIQDLTYTYYKQPRKIIFFDKDDKKGPEFADEQAIAFVLTKYPNNDAAADFIDRGHYVYHNRTHTNPDDNILYFVSDKELVRIAQDKLWCGARPSHDLLVKFVKDERIKLLSNLPGVKEIDSFFI